MMPTGFARKYTIKLLLLAKQYWPYSVLLVFGLLVVWPWFAEPGFLFLLDFVSPPSIAWPPAIWQINYISGLLYQWIVWSISQFIPAGEAQKIMFSLPLFLASIAMYQLCRWLLHDVTRSKPAIMASLAAGLFYSYNPFVTTRIFMGHVYLLFGYSLLPWVLLAWLKFQYSPSSHRSFWAGLAIIATLLMSAHHFIITPLLLIFFWPRRAAHRARLYILLSAIAIIIVALAVYQWTAFTTTKLHPLGPYARSILAPYSGSYIFDVLNLSATWKIDLPFIFPWEGRRGFGLISILLLIIMAGGLLCIRRQAKLSWLASRLVMVILASLFLAIGVAHPVTAPVTGWLYRHVPFWIGLRDSAKFISLIALAESILLAEGIYYISYSFKRKYLKGVFVMLLVSPVFYLSSTALYGYNNQIYPLAYPDSWYQVQNWLANNHQNKPKVLFLPWHMYLPFSFTNYRTIANPSSRFFTSARVIYGNNNEVGGTFGRPFISAENTDLEHQSIQDALNAGSSNTDLGVRLAPLCIEFVMLAIDTPDAADYDYLFRQNDLDLVVSQSDLILWRNRANNLKDCS